jgi:hypothetical protein
MEMKQPTRSMTASILGLATTLILAAEFIDFDNFEVSSVNAWVKVLALMLPAIGGWMSEIKGRG